MKTLRRCDVLIGLTGAGLGRREAFASKRKSLEYLV